MSPNGPRIRRTWLCLQVIPGSSPGMGFLLCLQEVASSILVILPTITMFDKKKFDTDEDLNSRGQAKLAFRTKSGALTTRTQCQSSWLRCSFTSLRKTSCKVKKNSQSAKTRFYGTWTTAYKRLKPWAATNCSTQPWYYSAPDLKCSRIFFFFFFCSN